MKRLGKFRARRVFLAGGLAATALGASGALAAVHGEQRYAAAPAVLDRAVPRVAKDQGIGERLIVVVGGTYASQAAAEAAAASYRFGELQGYYVVPVGDFQGLGNALPTTGRWALASAFRTMEGAKEFAALASAAGAPAFISPRVESLGGVFAGLGQEADPAGSGPLTHVVPASAAR